jgi:DNA-binding transcriptional LysR family regulator
MSPRYLVASPAYLQAHSAIRRPADLAKHDYIRFAWLPTGDAVELHGPHGAVTVATRGRYRVNNALAIRESLAMGMGVGLAPEWLVRDLLTSGQLVHVLPKWSGPPQEAFLLYPSRRYQSLRARLFIAFLQERIGGLPGFQATA